MQRATRLLKALPDTMRANSSSESSAARSETRCDDSPRRNAGVNFVLANISWLLKRDYRARDNVVDKYKIENCQKIDDNGCAGLEIRFMLAPNNNG